MSVAISLRVSEADLEEIDRRAGVRGISRTAYMLAASLAHDLGQTAAEEREGRIERRLSRLEAVAFG